VVGGFVGHIGGTGGAEAVAEEAEEWDDVDDVVDWDRWDSQQPEAVGPRGSERVRQSVRGTVASGFHLSG
jgi:hypothetical protein